MRPASADLENVLSSAKESKHDQAPLLQSSVVPNRVIALVFQVPLLFATKKSEKRANETQRFRVSKKEVDHALIVCYISKVHYAYQAIRQCKISE